MIKNLLKKPELGFIIIFLAASASLLLFIFALAIIVDPHNDFGTNLFKPLVMTNRTEKLKTLSQMPSSPQILILGSSRVYSMDPDLIKKITGKSAYNSSVSYARPEDHWAMINYIISDLKIKPELIIVGLNLGELNNDDTEPQTINNKNLVKYLNADPLIKFKNIIRSFKDSINPKYIRDIAVSILKLNVLPDRTGLQTQDFLPNGRIISPPIYFTENRPESDFDETYIRAYELFKNTAALNPMRKLYLENFIAFSNQNNIKVKIALLPMPPQILDKLYKETSYPNLYQEFLKYINELHSAYQFGFYDFSAVEKFNGLKHDFDDATHPGPKNIEKITKIIFDLDYAI